MGVWYGLGTLGDTHGDTIYPDSPNRRTRAE